MNTQQHGLASQWFAQLDRGVIDDKMTRQIAQAVEEWGGFGRLAHWMSIELPKPVATPRAVTTMKTWFARLLPDPTGRLAVQVRGDTLKSSEERGAVLVFDVPESPDWRIEIRVDEDADTGAIRMKGRLLSTGASDLAQKQPAPQVVLLSESQEPQPIQLDNALNFTIDDVAVGDYEIKFLVGEVAVELGRIRLDDSGNTPSLTAIV